MPSVAGTRLILLGTVIVTAHDHRATHNDLANLTCCDVMPILVHYAQLREGVRSAGPAATEPRLCDVPANLGLAVSAETVGDRRMRRHHQCCSPVGGVAIFE